MFWSIGASVSPSKLHGLLKKADVTLAEVLEEEDLLQEVKSNNTTVVQL